jgi:site-specific DNA-adenine methylase
MPIPYMGSKRKSAGKIYQTIKNLNPNGKILVDLFCGGFAISEYFIKNGWSVIANDKNKYVIELLKKALSGYFNEKVFIPGFITREKFKNVLKNKNKYEDWFVGYVMCIWSFGNNQKTYLFSKEKELYKKAGQELVINKNPEPIRSLVPNISEKYIDGILKQGNWHKRRRALGIVVNKVLKNKKKSRIFQLERLEQLERLQRLEQMLQMERLQQLERLEQIKPIELYSKNYNEIEITKEAIIYCDPPYEGTEEYEEKQINYKKFWEWCRKKRKTNKIYISEYKAPSDFKKVLEFPQKSLLQVGGQKHDNHPNECLFTID